MDDDVVLIDGALVAPRVASISIYDRAFIRGDSVFEVLRIYDGHALGLGEHLVRVHVVGELELLSSCEADEALERRQRRRRDALVDGLAASVDRDRRRREERRSVAQGDEGELVGDRLLQLDDESPADLRSLLACGSVVLERPDLAWAGRGDDAALVWLLGPAAIDRRDALLGAQ